MVTSAFKASLSFRTSSQKEEEKREEGKKKSGESAHRNREIAVSIQNNTGNTGKEQFGGKHSRKLSDNQSVNCS